MTIKIYLLNAHILSTAKVCLVCHCGGTLHEITCYESRPTAKKSKFIYTYSYLGIPLPESNMRADYYHWVLNFIIMTTAIKRQGRHTYTHKIRVISGLIHVYFLTFARFLNGKCRTHTNIQMQAEKVSSVDSDLLPVDRWAV